MRLFLSLLIVVVCQKGFSQIPAEEVDGMYVNWSGATIHFVSGEQINCAIRFDQINQNMEVKHNDYLLEIPFDDIRAFNFYDSVKQQHRFFEKITVPSGKVIMMEYLFENDKTAILQERFVRSFHMVYPDAMLQRRDFYYTAPVDKKFLFDKSSGKALVLTKQNLLALLKDNTKEINAFIKQNKINFEDIESYIAVLDFYDQL